MSFKEEFKMFDVMDFEDQIELYYDGNDIEPNFGMSEYSEKEIDWALEESCWNNPVKEVL